MSGAGFLWFLEELWFDLTNLGTADLPSLFFRLVLLFLVIFFGTFVLRVAVTVLGRMAQSYVFPLLSWCWDVLTYPVRLPFRLVRRIVRRVQDRRRYRAAQEWEQRKREEAERERREEEARERERLAQIERMLRPD